MKAACILIVTFLTFSSFAQPFKADTFGRVIDPAFIPFIKSREYQLVENFTSDNYNNLKLAYVWKNEKLVCIDLMGREFSSKDDAEDFYRNSEKNSFFNDNDRNESNAIYTYVGEEEPKKDPLKSRFTDIYTLENGLAKVQEKGLYGIYTAQGKEVIPPIFKQIDNYATLNCYVCQRPEDKRYYIYDSIGLLVTDCGFYKCDPFGDHSFRIQDKEFGEYGLWDFQTRDTILPLMYENIEIPLSLWEQKFGEITLIADKKESQDELEEESNWREQDQLMRYGIIDLNGKMIIEPKYQWIQHAEKSGCFILKLENKYGLVDETNQLLLPFEYDKLSSLDIAFTSIETNLPKHLFIFQEPGKKVGVMNRDKKVMVEPVYDGMAVTYNGLLAFQGELTGLISVNGEIIVPFQKMKVNNVGHGKISGSINDKRCTLDFYGNVVFGNRPSGF